MQQNGERFPFGCTHHAGKVTTGGVRFCDCSERQRANSGDGLRRKSKGGVAEAIPKETYDVYLAESVLCSFLLSVEE